MTEKRISDLTKLGDGNTAEIFAWGEGQALKLFRPGWGAHAAEREVQRARAASEAWAGAPAVFEMVEIEGRAGIVFARVEGPPLMSQIVPRLWNLSRAARLLADLHYEMHQRQGSADLPDLQARLRGKIEQAEPLPPALKEKALDALAELPEGDALLHGDFHPMNVHITEKGPVVIDWLDAARGHPLADVMRTLILLENAPVYAENAIQRVLFRVVVKLTVRNYLRRTLALWNVAQSAVEAWRVPVAAGRLSEGIQEEEALLINMVEAG